MRSKKLFDIDSRLVSVEMWIRSKERFDSNAAYRWQIEMLESKIKALQDIVIKAGLVEDFEDPIKKDNTVYRLGDGLYTVKKGK